MEKLWQLKNIKTGEALNSPQVLPENWGPIFGLRGILEKLGDLSWLGPQYENQGWIEVGELPDPTIVSKDKVLLKQIEDAIKESDSIVAADNTSITKGQLADWIEYRRLLREIPLQGGFPEMIDWPLKPE